MIVRRFMNWLRRTMTASLDSARQRSMEQKAREPLLVGSQSLSRPLTPITPSVSLSNWLDNGRRLRPRVRLTPQAREAAETTTRPLRAKSQPATTPISAETPALRVSLPPLSPDLADTAPIIPSAHLVDGQASDDLGNDLSDLERLDTETRRLMLLRHLVRRRVFNEGFVGADVPKQYRKSLGLESPPPQE